MHWPRAVITPNRPERSVPLTREFGVVALSRVARNVFQSFVKLSCTWLCPNIFFSKKKKKAERKKKKIKKEEKQKRKEIAIYLSCLLSFISQSACPYFKQTRETILDTVKLCHNVSLLMLPPLIGSKRLRHHSGILIWASANSGSGAEFTKHILRKIYFPLVDSLC